MTNDMDGTSKGLLGAFAVFTLGSGIATLAYGVLILLRYLTIEFNYGLFSLFAISIALIAIGSLLIITVLLGVFGALKDVSIFRMVTLVLLFLLFVVLAVIGVWTMVSFKTGQLERSIDLEINRLSEKRKELLPNDLKKADYIGQHYNCCGASTDNKTNIQGQAADCCIIPGCEDNPLANGMKYFEKGCADVYFQTKSVTIYHVALLTLAAAGGTLLGLILYGLIFQRARAGYAIVSHT